MALVAVLGLILSGWGNSVKAIESGSVELEMCISHDPETETYIFSLAEYDGKLYAGTYPNGKIYVHDGTSWDEVYSTGESHVWSLAVYDGKLYAGTEDEGLLEGTIYVYDGNSWDVAYETGESIVNSLAVYDGRLYAGTYSRGRIYVYDGTEWTLDFDVMDYVNLPHPTYGSHVFALAVYNGKLYAGTDCMKSPYPEGPLASIYVYDGSTWDEAYNTGEAQVRSLAVYDGKLYAGTGWTGGEIYVYNGTAWSLAYDSPTGGVYSLAVWSDNLYAGTIPGKIYGFDGLTWVEAFDSGETYVMSLATYAGNLYAGTSMNGRIYGPCWLEVGIDIKPGSYPNCFNLNGNGVIPVAILGSAEFEVAEIDVSSLDFAGLDIRVKGNDKPQCSVEDVSGDFTSPEGAPDGYDDLVCQYVDDPTTWSPGDGTATLTGSLLPDYGGTPIRGFDEICLRPE